MRSPTRQDDFQTGDKVFMTERRRKKNNLSSCAQLFQCSINCLGHPLFSPFSVVRPTQIFDIFQKEKK